SACVVSYADAFCLHQVFCTERMPRYVFRRLCSVCQVSCGPPAWTETALLVSRMLAKLNTFALVGIEGVPVEAEVDASAGLPKTVLVGLPEMAVRESIHRIERALANLGYDRHPGRTVINLAPADLRKDAGGFDLPIALG